MLKRLYVDNFRCLTNFELKLDEANVLLGAKQARQQCWWSCRSSRSYSHAEVESTKYFPRETLR